jgi:hypothetical protein
VEDCVTPPENVAVVLSGVLIMTTPEPPAAPVPFTAPPPPDPVFAVPAVAPPPTGAKVTVSLVVDVAVTV